MSTLSFEIRSSEEANALVLISSLSEKFADKSTKKHIENALNKIKAVLRKADKSKADNLQSQIKIYNPPTTEEPTDFLTGIQNAITNKTELEIEYVNNSSEHSKRKIEPIGLTFYSNQWHLIAWCRTRNAYRDFKVNRISRLTNRQEPFKKQNHYDINDYIKSLA